jgi:tRNA threonylcarbamoyladenosine biosynthesis protein TsaB
MNLLAIDTCTEIASVTLMTFESRVSRVLSGVQKSSGHILKLCDEVFQETDTLIKDVDSIIFTKGPGAFTGVRMCVGVVQGLSMSRNIPTMGFSTLELLGFRASQILNSEKIAVALDARMGEVYWAIYNQGKISKLRICNPRDVDILDTHYIGVGTGWDAYGDMLSSVSGVIETDLTIFPESSSLIDLALESFSRGESSDFELPQPIYLRNNVAQKSLK